MITLSNIRTLSEAYIDSDDMFPGCSVTDMEYLGESIIYPYMDNEMINEGVLGSVWETIKRIVSAIVNFFRTLATKIAGWIKGFFGHIKDLISRDGGSSGESSNETKFEVKPLFDMKTAAGVTAAFGAGVISSKDFGKAMADTNDATDKQKADAAAASKAAASLDAALASVTEMLEQAKREDKALKDLGDKVKQVKDAAKALNKPEPKTIEDAQEIVTESKRVSKSIKDRLKGSSVSKKSYNEAGAATTVTICNIYSTLPTFSKFDEDLTDYIVELSGVTYGRKELLEVSVIDHIEELLAGKYLSKDSTDEEKEIDKQNAERIAKHVVDHASVDRKDDIAKILSKVSKNDILSNTTNGSQASKILFLVKDNGTVKSDYVIQRTRKFNNKKDAQAAVRKAVDNCEKWAESASKLCNNAKSEYKKYEDKIKTLAAKYSSSDPKNILNAVKFQQLKAGVFNTVFSIHVKCIRDAVKTMTKQYLGKNPSDLKTDVERGQGDRKNADKAIANAKKAREEGKV